jgi:ABC-type nitrate/sulfonate/bicarbonate transport system permease component
MNQPFISEQATADDRMPHVANGERSPEPAPRLPRSWTQLAARWALPLLSLAVFLGVWQYFGSHINPILLATPSGVATAFYHMAADGILGPAMLRAAVDLAAGYVLAVIVGIGFGILMGRSRVFDRVMTPYVNFFQATPLVGLVPLIVIWFGIGYTAEIAVTFLLAVWTIIINTSEGVKATSTTLLDMAEIYHVPEMRRVRDIALPNAVPYIFAGLKIAMAKALIGMVIAGMDVSLKGLGGLITNYGDEFQTAQLMAAIATSSLIGVIFIWALELVRRHIAPWSIETRDGVLNKW